MAKGLVHHVDEGMIENYQLLTTYRWVDEWLEMKKTEENIEQLEKELNAIRNAPLLKKDRLRILHGHFINYQNRRIAILQKFFGSWNGYGDPFLYLTSVKLEPGLVLPPALTFGELEMALDSLPETGLSEKDRSAKINKIEPELKKLREKVEKLFPPEYLGKNGQDTRAKFIEHWERLQSQACEPIAPDAYALENSSEAEKSAWKKLSLKELVNKDGLTPR